jgi:hypothetical protein
MQIKITSKDFTLEYQDEFSLLDERAVSQVKNLIEFIVKETKNQPTKEEQLEKHLVPSSSNQTTFFGSAIPWLDSSGDLRK